MDIGRRISPGILSPRCLPFHHISAFVSMRIIGVCRGVVKIERMRRKADGEAGPRDAGRGHARDLRAGDGPDDS